MYKSIFARFGQIKAGKFVDDETGEDLSDVQKVLAKFNIELYNSEGEMRNVGSILDEVASKWNTYNDVQKNALTTALAGTRQRENLIVLFENYGNALKYEEAALNSAGTASQKFAVYQNSLEAAQERITNAFEKFSQTLIDGGTIKGLSQIAEKGIDVLSTLAKIRPVLQGILQILLVFKTLHFASMLIAEGKAVKALKSAYDKFKTTLVDMRKFRTLNTEAAKLQKEATEAQTVATRLQSRADDAAMAASMGKATAAEAEAAATAAATAQTEANIKATKAQEAAQKAANASANVYALIITAVVATGVAIFKYRQSQIKKLKEEAEAAAELTKTYQSQRNILSDLKEQYLKLAAKTTLTSDEEEQKLDLQKQIIEAAEEVNLSDKNRIAFINAQNKSYQEQRRILNSISADIDATTYSQANEAVSKYYEALKKFEEGIPASTFSTKDAAGDALEELKKYDEVFNELFSGTGIQRTAVGKDTPYNSAGSYTIEIEYEESFSEDIKNDPRLLAVEYYKAAQEARNRYWSEAYSDEWRKENSEVLKEIENYISKYGEDAQNYINAVRNKNTVITQSLTAIDRAIAGDTVKSKEDRKDLIKELEQEAKAKYNLTELSAELEAAIKREVDKYYPQYSDEVDQATVKNTVFKESFASLQKEMATVREAYSTLTSAIKEYNDSGYISVDTFEKLLSTYPEYLKYLFDENGHIQDNTDALKENIKIKIYSEALSSANDLIAKAEAGDLSMLTDAIREDTEARQENINAQLEELYVKTNALNISKEQKEQLWAEVGYRLKLADATIASLNSTSSATSSEDKYAKAVKYAQQVLQDKIDALKKEKEAIQERNEETQKELDLMDKALAYAKDLANDRIKALEEEKNALKEKNDEKEKELELQQLEENLTNAKRRKVRVYRQDIDKWVWEADESEVAAAQKALDDFKLEQKTEAIDAEIGKWNEYIEKLGEVTTVYEEEQKKLAFEQMQQYITQGGVNSRNLKQLENFAKAYAEKQKQIADNTTDEIDKQINKYEELKDQWGQIKTDYENAENARIAAQLLGAGAEEAILNGRLDTYEEFKKKYDAYLDGQADKASSTASSITNSVSEIMNAFNQMNDFSEGSLEEREKNARRNYWRLWMAKHMPEVNESFITDTFLDAVIQMGKEGKLGATPKKAIEAFIQQQQQQHARARQQGLKSGFYQTYASGTKSSARGIALTDENGLELRIPNKGNLRFLKEGTGVLPNNLTERVFAMASNPVSYARKVAESMSNKTVNNTSKHITIGNVSLPNVTNAQSFIKELEIITQNR